MEKSRVGIDVLRSSLKKVNLEEGKGIEALRHAVELFRHNRESFNYRYTAVELLLIADACARSDWDIWPDNWTTRQVEEAIKYGYAPNWKEDERTPIYMPKPKKKAKRARTSRARKVGNK